MNLEERKGGSSRSPLFEGAAGHSVLRPEGRLGAYDAGTVGRLDIRLCDVLVGQEDEQIDSNAIFRVRSEPIEVGIGRLVEMNWDMRWSKERVDTPKPYCQLYAQAKQNPVA